MDIERLTMKSTKKAPYQAPKVGDLDLMLERALLNASDVVTRGLWESPTNEAIDWVVAEDY